MVWAPSKYFNFETCVEDGWDIDALFSPSILARRTRSLATQASVALLPLRTEACYRFQVSTMTEHFPSPDRHVYWVCRFRSSSNLYRCEPNWRR